MLNQKRSNSLKFLYCISIFINFIFLQGCLKIPMGNSEQLEMEISHYCTLPSIVNECSGIIVQGKEILIINDGGGGPILYKLNSSGTDTIETIKVNGVQNVDWETILAFENEIVVGDFGNNLGKRQDLKIYHLDDINYELKEEIQFSYPDQNNFDISMHNFDCEAMVIMDNDYVLFTKNRANSYTNIYKSPVRKAEFVLYDSIEMKGQVTDAFFHDQTNTVLILSYTYNLTGFTNYLTIVKPLINGSFKKVKVFDIPYREQIEAITLLNKNEFLIGSENGFFKGGNLYKIIINGL